ncbi:hypothetical protein LA080_006529 [Diaporthe eres]|nr:hypothetical protein LA080_006529 [Diaporthe eres]
MGTSIALRSADPFWPPTLSRMSGSDIVVASHETTASKPALIEVLRDGQKEAATYTHIGCKIGGIERAAIANRVLSSWLEDNPQATVTYMFVDDADCGIVWKHAGLGQRKMIPSPSENVVRMMTYASWVKGTHKLLEKGGNLIFLMDLGFGVRTAQMTMAAMKMLHDMQELLRGRQTGTTITWVSVSCTAQAVLCEKAAIRVDGLLLPPAAVDRILDECIKDGAKRQRLWNMALACVTSVGDAYRIRHDLAGRSRLQPVTIQFIQPWMDRITIQKAVSASEGLKIICIDPQVSLVPAIHNLEAVILAPLSSGPAFDINTTGIVRTKVAYDVATALTFSLRGVGRDAGRVDVHVSQRLARLDSMVARNLPVLEEKTDNSTASDKDFIYLNLASVVATCYYPHPGILAATVPLSTPKLDEATRRLEAWRLVERTENYSVSRPRFIPTSPLGRALSNYVTKETNMHSLILLGLVKPEMPICVQQVLVNIAALVSQGLSSFFDLSTTEGQRDHRKIIQSLGDTADFARNHCHKGLLWQALAYLHCFRKTKRLGGIDLVKPPNKILDEAVRYYELREVDRRAGYMSETLKIPFANEAHLLSDGESPTVEKAVAVAFAFNFMRVPVEEVGYFARDITSDVKEAKEGGDLQVMAIYTDLWMDVVQDGLKVYRAVGTTAISNSAFCDGLMDLGIEHYGSLCPPARPKPRHLVPRGGS